MDEKFFLGHKMFFLHKFFLDPHFFFNHNFFGPTFFFRTPNFWQTRNFCWIHDFPDQILFWYSEISIRNKVTTVFALDPCNICPGNLLLRNWIFFGTYLFSCKAAALFFMIDWLTDKIFEQKLFYSKFFWDDKILTHNFLDSK